MTEYLHKPAHPTGHALVLTHGAGGNVNSPLLLKTAEAFTTAGFFVLRYTLPFRQKKSFGPPMPSGAQQDRDGLRSAVHQLKEMAPLVSLGGHSYGGRQASMLAAEEPALVEGLLLLSYPLHPPRKPEQLRTAHFGHLQTPAVFVHGTKDEFGNPDELSSALSIIPAKTKLLTIEGAGHDLMKGAFDIKLNVISAFIELIKPS